MDFRTDKLLHGGDYNPEQWLKRPDILAKDIDMLEESGCNVVSLGIFSWSTLEPEEGVFNFGKKGAFIFLLLIYPFVMASQIFSTTNPRNDTTAAIIPS